MDGSFTVGLDLGQVNDFSALAVVERVLVLPAGTTSHAVERHGYVALGAVEELRVRHLQRWALGTLYHVVVADVSELMRRDELEASWLYFDATGVGRAVKDMFAQSFMAGQMGYKYPIPVTITGGEAAGHQTYPKRDLMAALQVPMQQGRFKVAAGLELGGALETELTSFRMKTGAAGRDTYEVARREGQGHGDLVIATALASIHRNPSQERRFEVAAV